LSRSLESELNTLKSLNVNNDKPAMAHALGNIGGIYLHIAKKQAEEPQQTDRLYNDKKANLNKSIEYSNKAIEVSDEVGDIEQMRTSYKHLNAAQKMNGNVKGAMNSYTKMMALKKTIFASKKSNDIEKKQIEYARDRRDDSMRQIAAEHETYLREQAQKDAARDAAQHQRQLDSANKTLTAAQQEKNSMSLALQKTQKDLSHEKQNEQEKEKKLTLAEEEEALQATDLKLKESKLELQQSQLQLQQSNMQLQQNELAVKDRILGHQRTFIYIGAGVTLLLLIFSFFIIREHRKAIQQKHRAERSEKFKQEFIANISHEIRTPMNAINGMTGLLLQKGPRPEQESYLKAIGKSSDILLHVINDVLDMSKIEAGKLELETIDFSLAETVLQVKETLSYRAEDKGLQLITGIDEKLDDVLVGDPYRLNQVLINIAGNALKFTEKGGVHIDLNLEKKEANYVFVKFSVSDTGIGIPAGKLATLFENFTQVSSSDTRKYGGTGLGLSISKHLVEMLGGRIAVESTVGSGTTFSFVLRFPLGSAQKLQQRIYAEQHVDGSILKGLRILIADDNEYNRLVVNETLHLMTELHTDLVVDGKEAVDMMAKNDYDLILMDVQMPVMNGMDATRYIREHLPSPKNRVPIIALTASVMRADLDLCTTSGMTAYVPKPFKPWQLINTIAEVTGREQGEINILNAPMRGKPQSSIDDADDYVQTGTITNLAYLRKFCEGDEKRMNKYIKVYLNALPAFYKNMEAATAAKDFTEVALHVHSFKPKWMMMGMKRTNELGIKIDQMSKAQNDLAFGYLKILLEEVTQSAKELDANS
jgi:signal transduction histidine kinase/DNA-binding response OmpR family regulator